MGWYAHRHARATGASSLSQPACWAAAGPPCHPLGVATCPLAQAAAAGYRTCTVGGLDLVLVGVVTGQQAPRGVCGSRGQAGGGRHERGGGSRGEAATRVRRWQLATGLARMHGVCPAPGGTPRPALQHVQVPLTCMAGIKDPASGGEEGGRGEGLRVSRVRIPSGAAIPCGGATMKLAGNSAGTPPLAFSLPACPPGRLPQPRCPMAGGRPARRDTLAEVGPAPGPAPFAGSQTHRALSQAAIITTASRRERMGACVREWSLGRDGRDVSGENTRVQAAGSPEAVLRCLWRVGIVETRRIECGSGHTAGLDDQCMRHMLDGRRPCLL